MIFVLFYSRGWNYPDQTPTVKPFWRSSREHRHRLRRFLLNRYIREFTYGEAGKRGRHGQSY